MDTPPLPQDTPPSPDLMPTVAAPHPRRHSSRFLVLLMVTAIILGAVMLLMVIADHAIPGDALYRADRGIEQMRLELATTDAAKVRVLSRQLQERAIEADTLRDRGDTATADRTLKDTGVVMNVITQKLGDFGDEYSSEEQRALTALIAGQNHLVAANFRSQRPTDTITGAEYTRRGDYTVAVINFGPGVNQGFAMYYRTPEDEIIADIAKLYRVSEDQVRSMYRPDPDAVVE